MAENDTCPVPAARRPSNVDAVTVRPDAPLSDYVEATALANSEAQARLGDAMLISWYDRDRNFESPQHVSECHRDSAVPGYVEYALSREAALKIDVEDGRFVFFYAAVDF